MSVATSDRYAGLKPAWDSNTAPRPRHKPASWTVRQWVNELMEGEPTVQEWAAIADNPKMAGPKRIAAQWLCQAAERGDLAELEGWIDGRETLADLRKRGVNTSVLKRASKRQTEYGEVREVELHDRAGAALDKLLELEKIDRLERGEPGSISASNVKVSSTSVVVVASADSAIAQLTAGGIPERLWPPALVAYAEKARKIGQLVAPVQGAGDMLGVANTIEVGAR